MFVQARHADGTPMSDVALRDQLVTMVAAGHETTAAAMAWAVERLVRTPARLARLADEAASGGDNYADAVAKETLRLRPPVPVVLRRLAAPLAVGEWTLPVGVTVAPCIHLIHHRPDVYPQPDAFMPERFLERPAGTYTWIPFGGGIRRCLGASFAVVELKTALGVISRRLRLRPTRSEGEPVVRRMVTSLPGRGAEVVVSRS